MTFSGKAKTELAELQFGKKCCMRSEAYGMLLFGKSFSKDAIVLQTDNGAVAQRFCNMIKKLCFVSPKITKGNGKAILVSVNSASDRYKILDFFGQGANETVLRINRANINAECDNCARSFLRGCFFAAGSVSNPGREYHFEFAVTRKKLSEDLAAFLGETGIAPKMTVRRNSNVLYLKDSESIEDMLTFMGATNATLEMMNVKIYKDIRNRENRLNNCDVANIEKTAVASLKQCRAIEYIESRANLDTLPEDIRTVARLRRDNPEMSLSQMGASMNPRLTRSGVNRRLQKLLAYAEEMRQKEEKEEKEKAEND
ncbi:MAG: DNA-binding protein WhiA [Acutalibacteraceae bacterium]